MKAPFWTGGQLTEKRQGLGDANQALAHQIAEKEALGMPLNQGLIHIKYGNHPAHYVLRR
jgi:hypothetical protein